MSFKYFCHFTYIICRGNTQNFKNIHRGDRQMIRNNLLLTKNVLFIIICGLTPLNMLLKFFFVLRHQRTANRPSDTHSFFSSTDYVHKISEIFK